MHLRHSLTLHKGSCVTLFQTQNEIYFTKTVRLIVRDEWNPHLRFFAAAGMATAYCECWSLMLPTCDLYDLLSLRTCSISQDVRSAFGSLGLALSNMFGVRMP